MKILCFMLLYIPTLASLYAQMCGGGIHEFVILVRDNTQKEVFSYEILAVSDTTFSDILQARITKSGLKREEDRWKFEVQLKNVLLDTEEVVKFMPVIKRENVIKNSELLLRLARTKVKDKCIIFNGNLKFWASEGYKKMFLLKITTNTQKVYLLSNLFGGCHQTTSLILGDKPVISHTDPY